MAKLPNRKEDIVANKYYEPVYTNIFDTRIQFPAAVDTTQRELVLDNIISVSGLETERLPDKVTQKYKGTTRSFAGSAIDDTSTEITITVNVNLDDSNSMFTYKMFKQWSNLIYNKDTGERGLAAEYMAGTYIIITVMNKRQQIFRTYTATDIFLGEALPDLSELNYETNEAWAPMEIKFVCDKVEVKDN